MTSKSEKCAVELRDLESLLRAGVSHDLSLLSFETKNLLSKGENYASTLVKVTARIKRTKDALEEDLHLVAKLVPASEYQKQHFKAEASFKKEIFIYEKLIPTYQELQKEAGIENSQLLNVTPQIYGQRFSLDSNKEEVDENVAILMENLQISGYEVMDRIEGIDFAHAKLALVELARYHALGITCKIRRPEFFEQAKVPVQAKMITDEGGFDKVFGVFVKNLCSDPRVTVYKDRIKHSFSFTYEQIMNRKKPENIWMTFTHGDLWVNNIMFRHDANKNPVDLKFIDFQMANYNVAMRDLPYFMLSSFKNDVTVNDFEELLTIYYETVVDTLKVQNLDVSEFTRKSFDEHLKIEASTMLAAVLTVTKFFTLEAMQDLDLNKIAEVMTMEHNQAFKEKAYLIVKTFADKEWI